MKTMRHGQLGMSIIELFTIMALLSVVINFTYPHIKSMRMKASQAGLYVDLGNLRSLVQGYVSDNEGFDKKDLRQSAFNKGLAVHALGKEGGDFSALRSCQKKNVIGYNAKNCRKQKYFYQVFIDKNDFRTWTLNAQGKICPSHAKLKGWDFSQLLDQWFVGEEKAPCAYRSPVKMGCSSKNYLAKTLASCGVNWAKG